MISGSGEAVGKVSTRLPAAAGAKGCSCACAAPDCSLDNSASPLRLHPSQHQRVGSPPLGDLTSALLHFWH
jgi:hypothetical protein